MSKIINVSGLCRDYKVAVRDGNLFQFMFSRKFNTINAVNNISFSINSGELVGFVGPNGAGKSTTIKMLSGILMPTSGNISVLGNDPFKNRKQNAYNIGVVFGQRSQLWWDLPIGDSFNLLKKIYKIPDDIYRKNLKLYNEYLEIEQIWNQPVRQLSLGQRMRAELAAAILHNPPLLFLDEPTIGLDVVAKRKIREFILTLNKCNKTTVILTTHDMKDIEEICERIILIDKGCIVVDSSKCGLKDMFNQKSIVHMNFNEPIDKFEIEGIISKSEENEQQWTFEFDKNTMSLAHLINEISKVADILDVQVKELAIEDIMHKIYNEGI